MVEEAAEQTVQRAVLVEHQQRAEEAVERLLTEPRAELVDSAEGASAWSYQR